MAIIKKTKNYRKKKIDSDDEVEDTTEPVQEISETLEELTELRKLRRKHNGIDAEKLLKGVEIKKKKRIPEDTTGWNLKTGGLVNPDAYRAKLDEDEGSSATKKLKLDAFASATNTLDVDKHMMEYIENEMRKRRGGKAAKDDDEDEGDNRDRGLVDIYEELYHIPDSLKAEKKEEAEGNVQLSTQMLTAIPEVDLGIDTRLKNIEETERAKRKLFEDTQRENDKEASSYQDKVTANFEKQTVNKFKPRLDQNLKATDEQAVARFKRRMRK